MSNSADVSFATVQNPATIGIRIFMTAPSRTFNTIVYLASDLKDDEFLLLQKELKEQAKNRKIGRKSNSVLARMAGLDER